MITILKLKPTGGFTNNFFDLESKVHSESVVELRFKGAIFNTGTAIDVREVCDIDTFRKFCQDGLDACAGKDKS